MPKLRLRQQESKIALGLFTCPGWYRSLFKRDAVGTAPILDMSQILVLGAFCVWQQCVSSQCSQGTDPRSRLEIERAAKIGAHGGPLYQPCSGCSAAEQPEGPRFKLCTGCRRRYFCSRECQVAAWPAHKVVSAEQVFMRTSSSGNICLRVFMPCRCRYFCNRICQTAAQTERKMDITAANVPPVHWWEISACWA